MQTTFFILLLVLNSLVLYLIVSRQKEFEKLNKLENTKTPMDIALDQIDTRLIELSIRQDRLSDRIDQKLDDHQKCIRYLLQQFSLKECENIFQKTINTSKTNLKKPKKTDILC